MKTLALGADHKFFRLRYKLPRTWVALHSTYTAFSQSEMTRDALFNQWDSRVWREVDVKSWCDVTLPFFMPYALSQQQTCTMMVTRLWHELSCEVCERFIEEILLKRWGENVEKCPNGVTFKYTANSTLSKLHAEQWNDRKSASAQGKYHALTASFVKNSNYRFIQPLINACRTCWWL